MSYGVAVGVVDKTDDPASLGRVRVRIPIIAEFRWARVVRPAAEANFLAPAVGDEVLIAFEGGSLDQPFVLGSLWNGPHRSAKKPQRSRSLRAKNDYQYVGTQ
jgi:uncharacterized protein involved in type VI secretion and phage assembly